MWQRRQYPQEEWGQSNTQSTCTCHRQSRSPFPAQQSNRKRLKDEINTSEQTAVWYSVFCLMGHGSLLILTLFWISSWKFRELTYSLVTVGTKSSLNCASWASAMMSSIFFFASRGRMSLMTWKRVQNEVGYVSVYLFVPYCKLCWCLPSTKQSECKYYRRNHFVFVCFCQFVTSMQRRGDGISFCFSCVVSTSRIPKGLFCLMAKASLCSRWYLSRLFPKNATSASDTHTQHKKCVTIMLFT